MEITALIWLWEKIKTGAAVLFLSGCLTYGVENYNPAAFANEENQE